MAGNAGLWNAIFGVKDERRTQMRMQLWAFLESVASLPL